MAFEQMLHWALVTAHSRMSILDLLFVLAESQHSHKVWAFFACSPALLKHCLGRAGNKNILGRIIYNVFIRPEQSRVQRRQRMRYFSSVSGSRRLRQRMGDSGALCPAPLGPGSH